MEAVVERLLSRKSAGELVMEGAYSKIYNYINAIVKGYSTGLLVLGEPGLGKSFTVRKALNSFNQSFECVEAYITPPELFLALWRCRNGKVLLLDDCYKLLEDPRCLSYLKSACASTEELNADRVVTNATQKPLQDPISGMYVPNSFIFNGKIIILTNTLNEKSSHIKAVLSRLDRVKLEMNKEQKFSVMKEIVKSKYSSLSLDERINGGGKECLDGVVFDVCLRGCVPMTRGRRCIIFMSDDKGKGKDHTPFGVFYFYDKKNFDKARMALKLLEEAIFADGEIVKK